MKRSEMLEHVLVIREAAAEISWGAAAWYDRLDEMADGGMPGAAGGGGSRSGDPADRTGNALDEHGRRRRDPTEAMRRDIERRLVKIRHELVTVLGMYRDGVEARVAPPLMGDPGCEVCTDVVAGHRCDTAVTREVKHKHKGREFVKRMRLCEWCRKFEPRVGRPPTADELVAHAQGRTVRVKVAS